jgi:LysR family transcriptional regulator, transcription activator of glutamate synthase operon
LRELLFAAGREAGFEPQVKLESNESQRVRRLVSRGMGVAILPRSDAVSPGAEVAVAALIKPPLSRDITLAWRQERRHPPAVTEFLSLAREIFTAGGGDQAKVEAPGVSTARAGLSPAQGRASSI